MTHNPRDERLLELLADRALFGLSAEEVAELDGLLAGSNVDPEHLDRLAADLARSFVPTQLPEMPAHVRSAILQKESTTRPAPKPVRGRTWLSWPLFAAVAACVLCAIGGWWAAQLRFERPLTEQRGVLLADAKAGRGDAVLLEWTKTPDPAAAGASGDVVWSDSAQRGFMRFHNLAANDPSRSQYQLWVFDADRDEKYPVDGGVFDIPDSKGDVIVPIQIKLPVSRATLFAVTVEPPGGVVVSNRQRLPLLAKVPPRNAG